LIERGAVPVAHRVSAKVLHQIEEPLLEQRVQLREVAVGVDDRMIDLLAHCGRAGVATRHSISLHDQPVTLTGSRHPCPPVSPLSTLTLTGLPAPAFGRMLLSTVMLISGATGVR